MARKKCKKSPKIDNNLLKPRQNLCQQQDDLASKTSLSTMANTYSNLLNKSEDVNSDPLKSLGINLQYKELRFLGNDYCEIGIIDEKLSDQNNKTFKGRQTENKPIADPQQTLKMCYFCNCQVPKRYFNAHLKSNSHKYMMKLAITAFDRVSKHFADQDIMLVSGTSTNDIESNTYCVHCNKVFTVDLKIHELEMDHKLAIEREELLDKLVKLYNDNNMNVTEVPELTPDTVEIIIDDENKTDGQVTKVFETVECNYDVHKEHTKVIMIDEDIIITSSNGVKIKVSSYNWHSIEKKDDKTLYCQLCATSMSVDSLSNHLLLQNHINWIKDPVGNDYSRKVNRRNNHCIICNLLYLKVCDKFHVHKNSHIDLLNRSLITFCDKKTTNHISSDLAVQNYTKTELHETKTDKNNKHIVTPSQNNLQNKPEIKSLVSPGDNFYLCHVCNVIVPNSTKNITEHNNGKVHMKFKTLRINESNKQKQCIQNTDVLNTSKEVTLKNVNSDVEILQPEDDNKSKQDIKQTDNTVSENGCKKNLQPENRNKNSLDFKETNNNTVSSNGCKKNIQPVDRNKNRQDVKQMDSNTPNKNEFEDHLQPIDRNKNRQDFKETDNYTLNEYQCKKKHQAVDKDKIKRDVIDTVDNTLNKLYKNGYMENLQLIAEHADNLVNSEEASLYHGNEFTKSLQPLFHQDILTGNLGSTKNNASSIISESRNKKHRTKISLTSNRPRQNSTSVCSELSNTNFHVFTNSGDVFNIPKAHWYGLRDKGNGIIFCKLCVLEIADYNVWDHLKTENHLQFLNIRLENGVRQIVHGGNKIHCLICNDIYFQSVDNHVTCLEHIHNCYIWRTNSRNTIEGISSKPKNNSKVLFENRITQDLEDSVENESEERTLKYLKQNEHTTLKYNLSIYKIPIMSSGGICFGVFIRNQHGCYEDIGSAGCLLCELYFPNNKILISHYYSTIHNSLFKNPVDNNGLKETISKRLYCVLCFTSCDRQMVESHLASRQHEILYKEAFLYDTKNSLPDLREDTRNKIAMIVWFFIFIYVLFYYFN